MRVSLALLLALSACSSRSSIPANDSDVTVQASTTMTSDVKYIQIKVHQLSDDSLVYDSGIQPSSDFQDTRQYLERQVALAGSTDFLFDADAFDTNQHFLKHGNTVQEATQPAGHPTTILIVIDLNAGDTNPTSVADITAVTDNIPVLYPPTLTRSAGAYTLHYKATDLDLDTDAGAPIDHNETLTYFSAVLAGNVDLSANANPGLFTEGQDFTFSLRDTQPVKVLSAVVDRLNQLTYTISELDPATGAFQLVESGEGYALFDGNIVLPPARRRNDPTGPQTGPIAVAVLKHGAPPTAIGSSQPPDWAVEAISRSDESLVVTPANVAYWSFGSVASFNRYEEQPDAGGMIVVDFKLRVTIAPPPGTTFVASTPPAVVVDTIKLSADGAGHFVFGPDLTEQATLPTPTIGSVSGGGAPGAGATVDGSWFDGSYAAPSPADTNPGDDERQVYLQDSADPTRYVYPENLALTSGGAASSLAFSIPTNAAGGSYDLVVCTYGRVCARQPGAVIVQAASCIPSHDYKQARSGAGGLTGRSMIAVDVAADIAGNLYVADNYSRVIKLDPALNFAWQSGPIAVQAVAIDPASKVYAADFNNSLLVQLNPATGGPLSSARILDMGGQPVTPLNVIFDSSGALYVLGSQHTVSKHHFVANMKAWVADWVTPAGNAQEGLTLAEGLDRIYTSDRDGMTLQLLRLSTGEYLGDVDASPYMPWGLAFDPATSRLYVAAYAGQAVLVVDATALVPGGALPAALGSITPPDGYQLPVSVRMNPAGGIMVADYVDLFLFGCPETQPTLDSVAATGTDSGEIWMLGTDLAHDADTRVLSLVDDLTSPTVTFDLYNTMDFGNGGEIFSQVVLTDPHQQLIENKTYYVKAVYDDGITLTHAICFGAQVDETGACAAPAAGSLAGFGFGADYSGFGVNNHGAVVGIFYAGGYSPIFWSRYDAPPTTMSTAAGFPHGQAEVINDSGAAVGIGYSSDFSASAPVFWLNAGDTSTAPIPLPIPAGAGLPLVYAIDAQNNVLGSSDDSQGNRVALYWSPPYTGYTSLNVPAGQTVQPHGLNDNGRIVGEVNGHAAIWPDAGSDPILLAEPAGLTMTSAAKAINGDDVIAGSASDANGVPYPVVWFPSGGSWTPTVLPSLVSAPQGGSYTSDITAMNHLVGISMDCVTAGDHCSVLWTPDGAGGWTILELPGEAPTADAFDMNDHDLIIGQFNGTGQTVGEIWLPGI